MLKAFLGLLSSDVAGLFSKFATQKRLVVDRIEVNAKAELEASLAYLGVIGAEGTPSYQNFQIKVFVDSPERLVDLEEVWNEAVQSAPLLNTLKPSTNLEIEMIVVG